MPLSSCDAVPSLSQNTERMAPSPVRSDAWEAFVIEQRRTILEQDVYLPSEGDGVPQFRASSAVDHPDGGQVAAMAASRVKAEQNGNPMWGVADTPQESNAYVDGWWDYDQWSQEWGRSEKTSISLAGWY